MYATFGSRRVHARLENHTHSYKERWESHDRRAFGRISHDVRNYRKSTKSMRNELFLLCVPHDVSPHVALRT